MDEQDDLEEREDPVAGLLGSLLVRRLRLRHDGEMSPVAADTGISVRSLQRYEKGTAPPRKALALLAGENGFSPALIERLQGTLEAHQLAKAGGLAGERSQPLSPDAVTVVLAALAEAPDLLAVDPAPAPWEDTGKPRPEDRRRADELWRRFLAHDRSERYRLARESAIFHTWSFAERLAYESEATAADSPAEALELAELALEIACGVKGTASWRARVEAAVLPFLGNAQRVGNDLGPARTAFAQARALHPFFSPDDPPLLDESRLPDREASLCREERCFPDALALHKEALQLSPPERKGAVLLNQVATLEQMGAYETALATLHEAEPHMLATGQPRDLFGLRFNTAVCLLHLGEARKAEELLPEIQGLAEQLNNALDHLRTRWLTARCAAGLGRAEEAVAILDRVCEEFLATNPPLPYDAALAGLDLAQYWLKEGNTRAVQRLAAPLEKIFRAKGIRREAAAALRLFCEAARREAVTLDLAQRVKKDVERAGRG